MMSSSRALAPVVAILSTVTGVLGGDYHRPHPQDFNETVIVDPTCHANVTVIDTHTVVTTTTVPTTCYVEVTDYVYVNSTIVKNFTEHSTETLRHTVVLTETNTDTVAITETETDTDTVEITETDTDSVTITTTDTVPATVTTYTTSTETLFGTTYERCPTSCSIDAASVTVFYWPTDRPHSYPPTYVNEELDYTFISPSVYLLIPSIKGTNSQGQHVGPSTTQWVLGLDLDEVSTIADGPSGTLTRQLELSDLGTDCPQTADASEIATLNDSRCAPILAAPTVVSSWANPCNACGRFGLFDPPYAVPTLTGGLIESTTEVVTTKAPPSSSAVPTGTMYVVYHLDGEPVSTDTIETTGISGETTSSVAMSVSDTTSEVPEVPATTAVEETTVPESTSAAEVTVPVVPAPSETDVEDVPPPVITPSDTPTVLPTPSQPDVVTGSAYKVGSGMGWIVANTGMVMLVLANI